MFLIVNGEMIIGIVLAVIGIFIERSGNKSGLILAVLGVALLSWFAPYPWYARLAVFIVAFLIVRSISPRPLFAGRA
jgi:hypothetical protein